jgi:hypothetical protein
LLAYCCRALQRVADLARACCGVRRTICCHSPHRTIAIGPTGTIPDAEFESSRPSQPASPSLTRIEADLPRNAAPDEATPDRDNSPFYCFNFLTQRERFPSTHCRIHNHFQLRRHLTSANDYRAAARRSAALRSTDGSASQTAAITAQEGITDRQTPIVAG